MTMPPSFMISQGIGQAGFAPDASAEGHSLSTASTCRPLLYQHPQYTTTSGLSPMTLTPMPLLSQQFRYAPPTHSP